MWLDSCRYLYMPRLSTQDVFIQTIRDGVAHKDFFAYAVGTEKDAKKYAGLLFGKGGGVYLDESALLVRPDVAAEAVAASEPAAPTAAPAGPGTGFGKKTSSSSAMVGVGGSAPKEAPPQRFHATVEVGDKDPISAFAEIVENVIQHFTAKYGTTVTITVDVEARSPDGFDAKLVRVVKENATTLKFKSAEFEAE